MVVQCPVGPPLQSSLETLPPWRYHNQMPLDSDNDTDSLFDDHLFPQSPPPPSTFPRLRQQGMRSVSSFSASSALSPWTSSGKRSHGALYSSQTRPKSKSEPSSPIIAPRGTPASLPLPPLFPAPSTTSSASITQHNPPPVKSLPKTQRQEPSPLPSPAPTVSSPPTSSTPAQKLAQKRRRPESDVDGSDTASLSVKKRRLRLHLITSRLSRPFSFPATHILNREATAGLAGDGKRFVKLSAYLSARRAAASAAQYSTVAHNPSSVDLLRRAAILNGVRLGFIKSSVRGNQIYSFAYSHQGQDHFGAGVGVAMAAVLVHHGMQLMTAARHFFPSPSAPAAPVPQHQVPSSPAAGTQWHTPNHVHTAPGPTPLSQHYGAMLPQAPPTPSESPPQPPTGRATKVEYNHARLPPSPKLKAARTKGGSGRLGSSPLSRSPKVRPTREREFDDSDEVDNDSVAFPDSELDNRYADDSDEEADRQGGYDFGAIFGGTAGGTSSEPLPTPDELDEMEFGMLDDEPEDQNDHFYEEYLEELDGLPWAPGRSPSLPDL